jgi:hypothetical protein
VRHPSPPRGAHFSQIVLQEQNAPPSAFRFLFERFLKRSRQWCVLLRGHGVDRVHGVALRAFATLGQLVIFRMAMSALGAGLRLAWTNAHLECIARIVCTGGGHDRILFPG